MPRLTLSRTMQADLKQAKSEAGVESHIHIHTKYIRSQKVCDVDSSCLWRDFIIKLVWTVLKMSSVTPLIKRILLLYRINTTILSGQEDEHSHRNTLSPLMIWSGCMK